MNLQEQAMQHISQINYCGGLFCMIMGYLEKYAAGVGAAVIIATFVFQQYHNYQMRKQGRNRNHIAKEKLREERKRNKEENKE